MSLTRADFMKLMGVAVASVLLTRCQAIPVGTPTARERLRRLWLRFGEVRDRTMAGRNDENSLGQEMIAAHRTALDEAVTEGIISAPAADLVQESYEAAIYHVWRSYAPITCYEPMMLDYAPTSANVLVKQSEVLGEIAGRGAVDPATLAKAQAALEHDMAFYELTQDETNALYQRILGEGQAAGGRAFPPFEALDLELSPEAREAARFVLGLLAAQ